jgi:hypothetical protein
MRGASHSRILHVAGVSQGRGGSLPHQPAGPHRQFWIAFCSLGELKEQRRVFITREEPEENPFGHPHRPLFNWNSELYQVAVLGEGSDVTGRGGPLDAESEDPLPPGSRLLLLSERQGDRLVGQNFLPEGKSVGFRNRACRENIANRSPPNGSGSVCPEPTYWDAVRSWEVQKRSKACGRRRPGETSEKSGENLAGSRALSQYSLRLASGYLTCHSPVWGALASPRSSLRAADSVDWAVLIS